MKDTNICSDSYRDLAGFPQPNVSSDDELYTQALRQIAETKKALAALFQRRFQISYDRSAMLLNKLEKNGIIGSTDGSAPIKILL